MYTSLEPIRLSSTFDVSSPPTGELNLAALARLAFFSNGVTRVLHGTAFRAAACTGALFHVELYVVSGPLPDLAAGVYHYGAHDHALRLLRAGDFRPRLIEATGGEPSAVDAPLMFALTSTWWRNAWKYGARAYRHAFWDSGTILANLVSVAEGQGIAARVIVGFADREVNALLDVRPSREAAIALMAVGGGGGGAADVRLETPALDLPVRQLSPYQVDYPEITAAHAVSSLGSGSAAAAWRAGLAAPAQTRPRSRTSDEPIEAVILRRGSSRRFSHAPISRAQLDALLASATSHFDADAFVGCDLYVIVNAVEDLAEGAYVYDRASGGLQLVRAGNFRREAGLLVVDARLAGDAAVNVYWLVNLHALGDRAYRAAQLSAAIEAGKLYLAAYARALGATGLTFFDDDVTTFFFPHASGKSVMFLTAVGHPSALRVSS
jgi:SagB-type dehydrogenase family enzyme